MDGGSITLTVFLVITVVLLVTTLVTIFNNAGLKQEFLEALNRPNPFAPVGLLFWNFFVYLPTALLTFGILVDVINQDFRYTIATLIGLGAILLNKIFGMGIDKWSGRTANVVGDIVAELTGAVTTPPTSYANCIVPGFESFESIYMPQSILLTTTIFTYFLFDFASTRDSSKNVSAAVFMLGSLAVQTGILYKNGCLDKYWITSYPILNALVAAVAGMSLGGFSYLIVKNSAPGRLPSAIDSAPPFVIHEKFNVIKTDKLPGVGKCKSGAEKCDAPSDKEQDQFVCEAYKNGELITSTIAE
jgi:hypothetical protein